MALLKTAEFKEQYDTDLGADSIQRFLDDAEKEIIKIFGAHLTQIDWLRGGDRYIFPSRPVSTITTVVETVGSEDTTLASDDTQIEQNGRSIKRLDTGTNARTRWGDRIKFTYVPIDETDQRKRVQLDLVKLAIQFDGLRRSTIGNQNLEMGDYESRRKDILSRLGPTLSFA